MAARRKKRLAAELDQERAESPVKITRRDAAQRQLLHAIEQFFLGGDPVVIHVLASTSLNVSRPVAKAAGHRPIVEQISEHVREEYRDYWRDMLNEPYNFFKHGGACATEELRFFNPDLNELLIWEACHEYGRAFSNPEPEMIVFLCWRLNAGRAPISAFDNDRLMSRSAEIFADRKTPSTSAHALDLCRKFAEIRIQKERSQFTIGQYDNRPRRQS